MWTRLTHRRWACLALGAAFGLLYLVPHLLQKRSVEPPPAPMLTLAQAQRRFPHRILIPTEVPAGFRLSGIKVTPLLVQEVGVRRQPPGPPTDRLGLIFVKSPLTAPYPMAMPPDPCSPAEAAGIRMGDRILAFRDSVEAHSLAGRPLGECIEIARRLWGRMHRVPGSVFSVTYQHEGERPRVWRATLPEPYRPCFDREPVRPLTAALIFESAARRGSFAILEREKSVDPLGGPALDMGIDIGGGLRAHFLGTPERPTASWEQGGLWIEVLNPQGVVSRDQILAIARSMAHESTSR